jgi:hypothetical protein
MRDNVELFVANGGNAAFFSGNVCWWQTRFENDCKVMVCYKDATTDPFKDTDVTRVTVNWYCPPVLRPENRMTGVSSRDGGIGGEVATDYKVIDANHWVFSGTGLQDGDLFGSYISPASPGGRASVIGYETDAASTRYGTLSDFTILAEADLGNGWNPLGDGPPRVTMAAFRPVTDGSNQVSGTVFTVGTTRWSRGLDPNTYVKPVEDITKNVLNRLSQVNAKSLLGMVPIFQFHSETPHWRWIYTKDPGVGFDWLADGVAFFTPPPKMLGMRCPFFSIMLPM